MSDNFEVYLNSTKAWHPCILVDHSKYLVKLKSICKFDEEHDNEVKVDEKEIKAEKRHLRPSGEPFGKEPTVEIDMPVEVWTANGGPYGWHAAKVHKLKKNVVYVYPENDCETMYSKKAIRLPNTQTAVFDEFQSINMEVPAYLKDWILSEEGVKLCQRCKERKALQECAAGEGGEYLTLVGLKASLDSAVNFLKFNFDNLLFVDRLKGVRQELSSKLTKAITAKKNQHKAEFSVPSEVVGMLVGSNYKKIKLLQDRYKCAIKITDDDSEQVKITVVGNDKATVELVERKLHITRTEYKMDKKLVSFLIGQKGERIKTIIENSQLIKIDFDNALSTNGERICLLYGSRDSIDDGIEYIEATKRLHELIITNQYEIEDLQKKIDEVLAENGQPKHYDTRDNNYKATKNDNYDRSYDRNCDKNYDRDRNYDRNYDRNTANTRERGDKAQKPRDNQNQTREKREHKKSSEKVDESFTSNTRKGRGTRANGADNNYDRNYDSNSKRRGANDRNDKDKESDKGGRNRGSRRTKESRNEDYAINY